MYGRIITLTFPQNMIYNDFYMDILTLVLKWYHTEDLALYWCKCS